MTFWEVRIWNLGVSFGTRGARIWMPVSGFGHVRAYLDHGSKCWTPRLTTWMAFSGLGYPPCYLQIGRFLDKIINVQSDGDRKWGESKRWMHVPKKRAAIQIRTPASRCEHPEFQTSPTGSKS